MSPVRSLVLLVAVFFLGACNCGGDAIIGGTGGSHKGGGGGSGGNGGGSNGGGGGINAGGGTNGGGSNGGGGTLVDPGDDGGMTNYDGGCGPINAGNPPFPHRCVNPPTANECDGTTDSALSGGGVPTALLNGTAGNGFDDDCDGLVDEGCGCPGNGQTKDCWLVPATQADPMTKEPVGWCNPNAKGSLDCAGGELATWSGVCRGANAPAAHDTCAMGDFNCDGLAGNSDLTGCDCPTSVVCPTSAITMAPFPTETNIPLVDGSQWIADATERAMTTGWTWTVLGGDCDNVLPFPTFGLYNSANSMTAGARKGAKTSVKFDMAAQKYVATPGQPLIAIQANNYGSGVAGGKLYTAFALSGDYTVQGEFDLGGQHFVCTQKVQVRAPGVRAELCWDTVGGGGTSNDGNDVDLHFARLQGDACPAKGWDDTCTETSGTEEDCYYASCQYVPLDWGYANSLATACHGWGSKQMMTGCNNPRLDRDNISCDPTESDVLQDGFCGPENINLDNPKDGDKFIVGVNHFGSRGNTPTAKPHVNVYCNGARVLSVGYNPATGAQWPLLSQEGADSTGDLWSVARVTTHVSNGTISSCDVETVPSHHADQTRDGPAASAGAGNALCVDSTANHSSPMFNYSSHKFVDSASAQGAAAGSLPTTAAGFCKH